MGQAYIGEIRMFGGSFAPAGWAFCDGQLAPISQNDALFTLIGTTYGGDGQETFGLPDLRGRLPMHVGNGHVLGESAGVESVTLTTQQMPIHNHPFFVSTASANQAAPAGAVPGNSPSVDLYREDTPSVAMSPQAISQIGGSQPHDNMQPYLPISFIISLFGIFPTQS